MMYVTKSQRYFFRTEKHDKILFVRNFLKMNTSFRVYSKRIYKKSCTPFSG